MQPMVLTEAAQVLRAYIAGYIKTPEEKQAILMQLATTGSATIMVPGSLPPVTTTPPPATTGTPYVPPGGGGINYYPTNEPGRVTPNQTTLPATYILPEQDNSMVWIIVALLGYMIIKGK